jgi:hypothetical protein
LRRLLGELRGPLIDSCRVPSRLKLRSRLSALLALGMLPLRDTHGEGAVPDRPRTSRWLLMPLLLCSLAIPPVHHANDKVNDFAYYWTAARQILSGSNPYAPRTMPVLEPAASGAHTEPLILRYPPWIAPLIAPFGLMTFYTAQRLWLVLGLMAVLLSARWLWSIYSSEGQSAWLVWAATALFSPVSVVLVIGQIGPLVLLGIAGFLHFEEHERPVLAGACLFLASLKPHLVFLLWVALLLWSIHGRTLKTLIGLLSITAIASLMALALDHSIFVQYVHLLRSGGIFTEVTPTIGGLLRRWLGGHYLFQMLPVLMALIWVVLHWSRTRERWRWRRELPTLLLVSLLTTSYGWFFDQVVLLPCVFQATAWATSRRPESFLIAALYLGTNAAALLLILRHHTTFWYVWTMPAWALLYGLAYVVQRTSHADVRTD